MAYDSKANRKYYLRQGRCPRCGGKNPVQEGRVLCIECQQKHDEGKKQRTILWRETGRCTRCGGERDGKYTLCAKCRAYMSDARRENAKKAKKRRDEWREKGLCTRCGRTWAEPGRRWCKKCENEHNQYTKGQDYRQKVNARREERRAAGLCIDCGKPTDGKHSRCEKCAERQRDSVRKRRIMQRIEREAQMARERTAKA